MREKMSLTRIGDQEDSRVIPAIQRPEQLSETSQEDRRSMLRKKERLNVEEAAFYLRVKKQTLYNLIHQGQGPRRHKRQDGRWEFEPTDLDAYLKATTTTYEAFR
jgi:excisionase family DNA binding protein